MIGYQLRRAGFVLALLYLTFASGCSASPDAEALTYVVEWDGKVFGSQEIKVSRAEEAGRPVVWIEEYGRSQASALGARIDQDVRSSYRLDGETWGLIECESFIDQPPMKLRIAASSEGGSVRITVEPGGGEKEVALGPDVIFENPVYFPHLTRDFGDGNETEKRYKILDLIDRKVYEVTYTLRGTESLDLAGNRITGLVFDSLNQSLGLKLKLWIDQESGRLLRLETPRGTVSLAEKSAKRGLGRANLDDEIYAPVGVRIADVAAISRLKVRAVLEPVGNWITAEGLNVRGQSFEGVVDDNRIDGIFEIGHDKYDGRNPPPFPADFHKRPELRLFLSPEDFIESDDPVLIRNGEELTAGAEDSWEAAKRLSRWVADNIGYDIPGGATARKTFDLREGECGAHSRLFAAFCRAVGIPARVVWGCMYVPDKGGSFGQHAWNEVYMGDAGWVPVDTTARQIDFVDSGHIRLGVLSSGHVGWNPEQMEVLDFEAGSQRFGESLEAGDAESYQAYLGRFRGPEGGVFTILLQGGGLAIDIPARGTYELRDGDDEGVWYLRLSGDVGISFQSDGEGSVNGLVLTNKVRIPRRADPDTIDEDVPEELRPYLGYYPIPMDKRDIRLLYRGGSLSVEIPGGGIRDLEGPDEEGVWIEKSRGDRYSFVLDESGKVRTMILLETVSCPRVK